MWQKMADLLIINTRKTFDFVNVEFADVGDEVFPDAVESEAALGHLLDSLILTPAFDGDSIDCTHRAGPVRTMLAMHKDWRTVGIGDNLQESDDILVLRYDCSHIDMLVSQSGIFQLIAVRMKRPQVNDCLDAKLL